MPGTFTQTWQMVTAPKLLNHQSGRDDDGLSVVLRGVAVAAESELRAEARDSLMSSLENDVRQHQVCWSLVDVGGHTLQAVHVHDKAQQSALQQ